SGLGHRPGTFLDDPAASKHHHGWRIRLWKTLCQRILPVMPIPTFDVMLRPILELAIKQDLTRRQAEPAMADHFALTEDERQQRIPSGKSTVVGNRAGWAMAHLTKAGLLSKVAPRTYRTTEAGKTFLAAHPQRISVKDLATIDGYREAWLVTKPRAADDSAAVVAQGTTTPSEAIDAALNSLNADLRSRLLDAILKQSPEFFERLVLDVLIKMGYGGSRE